MTLDFLALKYETDKGPKDHGYMKFYEQYFAPIRLQIRAMLEVGIADGKSLKVWEDYFPRAKIYGVDQNSCNPAYPFSRHTETYKIEQTDSGNLQNSFRDKRLEIIIDDASHEPDKTFTTFEVLYPLLCSGGYYCIEDIWWSFCPRIADWLNDHQDQFDWMNVHSDTPRSSTLIVVHKK
jgi:hypothetical protein